jgi:hypothetical protein
MEVDDFVSSSASKAPESVKTDTAQTANQSAPVEETSETPEDSETSENGHENQDADSAQDDQGQGELEEQAKPKKKTGFEKRIERFQKQLSQKDQELMSLKAQLEGKSKGAAEEKPQSAKKSPDQKPDPNDFETNADYIEAVTDWKFNQAELKAKQTAEQQKHAEARQKVQSDYDSRLSEFKKSTPDFDDVVANFMDEHGDLQASPKVIEALQTSEVGPQLLYDILNTPGEYERFQKMTELQAIRELGKKEANLSKSSESPKTITTSKAPAPVKPITAAPSNARKSLADMSVDEYVEHMNAKTRRK